MYTVRPCESTKMLPRPLLPTATAGGAGGAVVGGAVDRVAVDRVAWLEPHAAATATSSMAAAATTSVEVDLRFITGNSLWQDPGPVRRCLLRSSSRRDPCCPNARTRRVRCLRRQPPFAAVANGERNPPASGHARLGFAAILECRDSESQAVRRVRSYKAEVAGSSPAAPAVLRRGPRRELRDVRRGFALRLRSARESRHRRMLGTLSRRASGAGSPRRLESRSMFRFLTRHLLAGSSLVLAGVVATGGDCCRRQRSFLRFHAVGIVCRLHRGRGSADHLR